MIRGSGANGRSLEQSVTAGNSGVPKPPLRIGTGGGVPGNQPTGPAMGGPLSELPNAPLGPISRTYQPDRFQPVTPGFVNLAQGESVVLVDNPPDIRVFLTIKNSRSSTGVVGIGFSADPNTTDTSTFELGPGESLLFDQFVPQNRIYAHAFIGACKIAYSFSNGGKV